MSDRKQKFLGAFSSFRHIASESELKELYDSIEDKSIIDNALEKYGPPPGGLQEPPNLSSFKHSINANLRVVATFATYVELHVPSLDTYYTGHGGGLLVGVGVSGGTLYYDDANDLKGGSDFNCNFFSAYANCNLIRHGRVYATYQGGGVPLIGVVGGSGKWKN